MECLVPWAPCSYKHKFPITFTGWIGYEFWITEKNHSLSGKRRWLCQSSLHERSLQTLCSDTPCPPRLYQLFASACLVFWECWRRTLPIRPSCPNTTGDSNLMQMSITAHQVECGLKIDDRECWFQARSRDKTGVWDLGVWGRVFQCHLGEPARQERRKWVFFHSWYANNRGITCYQHLHVICVYLISRFAVCLTHRRTEWADRMAGKYK